MGPVSNIPPGGFGHCPRPLCPAAALLSQSSAEISEAPDGHEIVHRWSPRNYHTPYPKGRIKREVMGRLGVQPSEGDGRALAATTSHVQPSVVAKI